MISPLPNHHDWSQVLIPLSNQLLAVSPTLSSPSRVVAIVDSSDIPPFSSVAPGRIVVVVQSELSLSDEYSNILVRIEDILEDGVIYVHLSIV